jgi:hypothetical protein
MIYKVQLYVESIVCNVESISHMHIYNVYSKTIL